MQFNRSQALAHRAAANATFKKDQRLNIRISSRDLKSLHAGALEEGALRHTRVFLEQLECLKQGVVVRCLAAGGHSNSAEVRVLCAE